MATLTLLEVTRRLTARNQAYRREEIRLEGFCASAVLIPLVEVEGECAVLLTRRTEFVETHKGQISFPGGAVDRGDRDLTHTALREAEEEVGIAPEIVEVMGMLDDLATPTGFIITPVVGVLRHLPVLRPNPQEVAEAFLVPLAFFLDPDHVRSEMREFRGLPREVWFYQRGEYEIWGATAIMIRSLLTHIGLAPASA